MAAHVRLKIEFTEGDKYQILMSWLIFSFPNDIVVAKTHHFLLVRSIF